MNPSTEYIVFRQHREDRVHKGPEGAQAYTFIDFKPIYGPNGKIPASTPEAALARAKRDFPRQLLAVQPLSEYLECLQKPTPSQPFPRPSAQRHGS